MDLQRVPGVAMKQFKFVIEFAFDDQSGAYECYSPSLATAIETFDMMVEELNVPIDIIRAYEVRGKHGLEQG
jgi:hypothetical protein